MIDQCHFGDVRLVLRRLIDEGLRVQMVCTSPPYWALRDYGVAGQLGLEPLHDCLGWATRNPCGECYICHMVQVFDLVREVLLDDGTCFVNMGDCYCGGGGVGNAPGGGAQGERHKGIAPMTQPNRLCTQSYRRDKANVGNVKHVSAPGLKPKDLAMMPARFALALQASGWWVRSDIIWHKRAPMPESVRDRPTKAHEYLFLLAKSEKYFYDADAISEPVGADTHARAARGCSDDHKWADGWPGDQTIAKVSPSPGTPKAQRVPSAWDQSNGSYRELIGRYPRIAPSKAKESDDPSVVDASVSARMGRGPGWRQKNNASMDAALVDVPTWRNKRTVWTLGSEPYSGAHFATFPQALVEPCILAGSRPGDIVLDPFLGSGTVAQVAVRYGRHWVGIDLDPRNEALQADRLRVTGGLALEPSA